MKTKIVLLVLLTLIACESNSPLSRSPDNNDEPSYATNPSNHTGKKIALVIGNWAYRFKPLNNPQKDARDMAQLLRQLGFEVIHKKNLGFDQMEDEVLKFKLKLMEKGQVGLFYFAGHGLEVEGKNYLLPTDLRLPETQLIKRKSIEAQWVVDVMEHAGSEVNIVIMDACRTFPRPDKPRATREDYGLAAMNAPKGTLIGFATGQGQSTPDGKKGTNGLYTGHLLRFMRQAGLSIEQVFKKTRQQVAWQTDNKQVPPVYNSLIGDFCLVSCAKPKSEQEKILQAQLDKERQKNEVLLDKERREKAALQAQLEALKNRDGKVFRDRLADGGFGPKMVWIPAGSFRMGDIQGGGDSDEQPVHEVSVGRFAMGQYEVTFAEYDKFAEATGRKKPSDNGYGRGNRPVLNVSWHDATAYAEWLSEQTGQTYRLPTEAEWEYAARAGTETARYWGNDPDKACGYANVHDNTSKKVNNFPWTHHNCTDGYAQTAPVGQFKPNKFGLYDMLGNLWEWTCSQYESKYSGKEQRCEKNVNENNRLSLRGGSWINFTAGVRTAGRSSGRPTGRSDDLGLRLSRL